MTFPTKIAVLLRDDLAVWQRLNVTAFVVSGVAGTQPELLGADYADADGTRYLPMFGQPVLVFEGGAAVLSAAHGRAVERGVACAVFTQALFKTGNDEDNRAAVRAVASADLNLVGLALHGPKNAVDRILKGARLHG
ncbi:MAG TPA: DUF2000 domain-containing protein [Dactylosporangium sp.]|nr:DUF2000 domain-containing protein [Dactylosporangium sp.]